MPCDGSMIGASVPFPETSIEAGRSARRPISGSQRREMNQRYLAKISRSVLARVVCRDSGDEHAGIRAATTGEAQHPLHHGRRHRLDAAEHLPPRPDGRRNAQHRPHRQRRRDLHGLCRHAELHLRAQRLLHRHVSAAHRHDPAAAAGQPVLSAARHAGARQVPARSRLQHRRVRQEPPGRPHRRRCRRRTASRNTGAISITSTRCRG